MFDYILTGICILLIIFCGHLHLSRSFARDERDEARKIAENLRDRLRETHFTPLTITLPPRRKIKSIHADGEITWNEAT